MRWTDDKKSELADRWHAGQSMSEIAAAIGVTRNSIIGASNRMNLQYHGGKSVSLAVDSGPAVRGVTRFPSRVQKPGNAGVLKPGSYQRKLGAVVTKGRWRGMPIYSLTLEERATCPRSCRQWWSCYGNASGNSIRYQHGDDLLAAIFNDLTALERQFPQGFVVRLHQLGDFFSLPYFEFWKGMLDAFPALRIFGYSARQAGDPIGDAIIRLRDERWDRFAVRTSGAKEGPRTIVVEDRASVPAKAILCPAQTGKTRCCATCSLCWATSARDKVIAFLQH